MTTTQEQNTTDAEGYVPVDGVVYLDEDVRVVKWLVGSTLHTLTVGGGGLVVQKDTAGPAVAAMAGLPMGRRGRRAVLFDRAAGR